MMAAQETPVVTTTLAIPEQVVFVHDATGRTISVLLRPVDDDDATRRAILRRRPHPDSWPGEGVIT